MSDLPVRDGGACGRRSLFGGSKGDRLDLGMNMDRTPSTIEVEFLGAAREVTGSCFCVTTRGANFLVDCGMFQGGRDADARNAAAPDVDARALDFVVLTHAHIDHSGLLPRLCARGYRGPIYATPATIDLVGVMLPDSAHIQEKDAEWARERRDRGRGRNGHGGADRRPESAAGR